MSYDQTSKQTNRHPNFLSLDVLMIEKNFTENNFTCFPIFEICNKNNLCKKCRKTFNLSDQKNE